MKHAGLGQIASIEGNNRNGLLRLGHLTDFADHLDNPESSTQGPVQITEAAAPGSGPEGAVRTKRQRRDVIARQPAIRPGFAVRLPAAVLVKPGQAAEGSGPEGALRSEHQ